MKQTPSNRQAYSVKREDDVPIRFTGSIIGQMTVEIETNSYFYRVQIFRTVGGKFVATKEMDASHQPEMKCRTVVVDSASELIECLRDEGTGALDPITLHALREAAGCDDEVSAAFGLNIE